MILRKKIIFAITCTLFFLITLAIVYIVHINFFTVDVVFYSTLFDVIISLFISIYFIHKYDFLIFEKIQLIVIHFLIGYIFAITIPTVIDRSLSIYILEKIDQRGGGIKLEFFPEIFIQEYLPEHRLADIRITEQLESGTIFIVGKDCVKLTDRGKKIVLFTKFFRAHLLPKRRLILNDYSSDLTNPFRINYKSSDYEC